MPSKQSFATVRRALLGAASIAVIGTSGAAYAQERATGSEESPGIIINNALDPNTSGVGGALDTGVTGVGQMIAFIQSATNPAAAGLSLCSGTLINPRTVIFAAHCVNARPAHQYGSRTGTGGGTSPVFGSTQGVPLSFGFEATNRCQGTNGCATGTGPYERWRDSTFQTQVAQHIYNANQIWYDTRSLTTPGSNGFIVADVAIATLDTPAFDVPTWSMLFSPLDGPTHGLQMGYGVNGTSASAQGGAPCVASPTDNCSPRGAIDYRRRAAENMISVLASLADRNIAMFGGAFGATTNNLYMLDFDSPSGPDGFNSPNNFDIDVFDGAALQREGTTAGGDSGGPLVVDQRYDRPVVAAVLSGGSRFFGAQRFSTYGTHSFYQPLHLYWDQVVANNPYVYAGNKAGNGAWEDLTHWVQLMDPAYQIAVNGGLVNSLPDTPAQGIAGGGALFGTICNGPCAAPLTGTQPTGNGTPVFIEGGPGSTNFVPDNVNPVNNANSALAVKARYYDVTLAAFGATTLSSARTIDRLTIDGPTKLDVKGTGDLRVLGDFTQWVGWTNVDGLLRTDEALVATGILTGAGTFKAPFLTIGSAVVAPAGHDQIGTLTVDGDMIMSSGSILALDARRGGADKLAVTGDLLLSEEQGRRPTLVMHKNGAAPRHGESYVIASAAGGVSGTFGSILSFQGVLRPELAYGPTTITANLRAGSLAGHAQGYGAIVNAFANALDALRGSNYDSLYGLYGAVDLMDPTTLAATLNGLNPTIVGETRSLQDRQSKVMLSAITDRLSMLGTGSLGRSLSIVGEPQALVELAAEPGTVSAQHSFASGLRPAETSFGKLPQGMSGFISGGFDQGRASYGINGENAGRRAWHVGMGLEMEIAENATLGTAFGYSNGYSLPGIDRSRTESRMTQAAVYGSYRLGGGAYVAGLAVAEKSRTGIDRQASTGEVMFDLAGATTASRYNLQVEGGVNLGIARGLTLTPRASLGYSSYAFGGYREGGGELALQIDELSVRQLEARLGARLAGATRLAGGWTFAPQLQADYVQNLSGGNDGMAVRFAAAPDQAFLLPLAGGSGGWAEIRGGLTLANGPLEFGAGVESSIGRADIRDDRAVADFTLRF